MSKFRKKPVVVEAMQWNGHDDDSGIKAALAFIGDMSKLPHAPDDPHVHTGIGFTPPDGKLFIPTMEGTMCANPGDWIIKGIKNEFYPCKPDVFAQTYEQAGNVNNFDVLKKMSADSLKLYIGLDLLRADKVKAGTQVTFGIGGDFVAAIFHKELIGCVLLWNKDEFDKVKKELQEGQ